MKTHNRIAHNRVVMPIGAVYGRLTIVGAPENRANVLYYPCRCSCGTEITVRGESLRSGNTTSCGCVHREQLAQRNRTHGLSATRIYRDYLRMISRCHNPKDPHYKDYGARGIIVCDAWRQSFVTFYQWAMAAGYADDLTTERVNVNGNYEPANCTWIPKGDQAKNRRCCRRVTIGGTEMCLADAARHVGLVSPRCALERVRKLHWNIMDAITMPLKTRGNKKHEKTDGQKGPEA